MSSDRANSFASFAKLSSDHTLCLTALEAHVLELYDESKEVCLEHALLKSSNELVEALNNSLHGQDLDEQLKAAEYECLQAKAVYLLKDSIVESILVTDPVLKAVHSGLNATPAEKYLHPLVDRRDVIQIAQTNLAASLQSASKAIIVAEAENIKAMTTNSHVATSLLDIANKHKVRDAQLLENAQLRSRLEILEGEAATAKIRWRIIKSVVAGVIVGSGVDWAADEALLTLVIDDEDLVT